MQDKIILNLTAKVLTPVHVGGAQEKHYTENLDYYRAGDSIYFLDDKKLINHFGIPRFSHALATNTMAELLQSIDKKEYAKEILTLSGNPGQEIKRHIRNQFDNKPIIPGSSLKGAIRSVLLNYLIFKNKHRINPKTRNIDKDIFGEITEDAMRFLQISDTPFDQLKLFNTKIMNLQRDEDGWFGGWKHGSRKTTTDFSEKGFTAGYECLTIGQTAPISIILNLQAYKMAKSRKKVKYSYALDELFSKNFEDTFLEICQKYHQYFTNSETAYFNQFGDYDGEAALKAAYEKLNEISQQSPLLRVGAGSGFHAMTGDWKYPNHIHPVEVETFEGKKVKGRWEPIYLKSRKFTFEYDANLGDNGDYRFYPMGYLQLIKK